MGGWSYDCRERLYGSWSEQGKSGAEVTHMLYMQILQVAAHTAHNSKGLAELSLKLILPILYPYVTEVVDCGQQGVVE